MQIISLIFFAIIALIVAIVLGIVCYLVAGWIVRRRNWSNKRLIVWLAAITPALIIGMEAVLGLIGSVYISETKGVDLGFGDYWQAPLTESHYLCAVDMPENASVGSRDNDNIYEGLVQHLWVAEDSILVACYSSGNDYALYAFHSHDSSIDTLLHRADSLQFANALQNRNIDVKTALTPDEYFNRAQREAHKIESPVRHTVVIVIILAFWAALLWLIKKNSSS
jgi:hypothetical protein